MNNIEVIFFDIDGTLVPFGQQKMNDITIDALQQLRNKGIKLFIASGRSKPLMTNLRDYPFDGYVSMNGSLVICGNEVLLSSPIHEEDIAKIARISKDNNIACVNFLADGFGMNMENDISRRVNALLSIGDFPIVDLEELSKKEPVYQCTIYVDDDKARDLYYPYFTNISWHRWHDDMMDAIPSNSSKAVGVDLILKHLGVDRSRSLSFGDGGNDVEMLQSTGISVAMGNARDEVKQHATFIADRADDDGVVKMLRQLDLIK